MNEISTNMNANEEENKDLEDQNKKTQSSVPKKDTFNDEEDNPQNKIRKIMYIEDNDSANEIYDKLANFVVNKYIQFINEIESQKQLHSFYSYINNFRDEDGFFLDDKINFLNNFYQKRYGDEVVRIIKKYDEILKKIKPDDIDIDKKKKDIEEEKEKTINSIKRFRINKIVFLRNIMKTICFQCKCDIQSIKNDESASEIVLPCGCTLCPITNVAGNKEICLQKFFNGKNCELINKILKDWKKKLEEMTKNQNNKPIREVYYSTYFCCCNYNYTYTQLEDLKKILEDNQII